MSQEPAQLPYAQPQARMNRRSTRKLLLVIAVLLIALAAPFYVPGLWDRFMVISLQRACMDYTPPPAKSARAQGSVPAEWGEFHERLSGSGIRSAGTVFLHSRRSLSGPLRLVGVDLLQSVSSSGDWVLYVRVVQPGTFLRLPVEISSKSSGVIHAEQVMPGAADPKDESHFTIRFVDGGQERVLSAWLRDDDQVMWKVEPLATTMPTISVAGDPTGR